MAVKSALLRGIEQLPLALTAQQIEQLHAYIDLIQKWNKAYNLVGTSESAILIKKHILDSLAIAPFVSQSPVLDVGSGAGLPGIPLAITYPQMTFTLCDANGKKARFMRQAVIELGLSNVTVEHGRIEAYQPDSAPMSVLARAFAPPQEAIKILAEVCHPGGQVMLMLGVEPDILPEDETIKTIIKHKIAVPELDSQRHLLVASKL